MEVWTLGRPSARTGSGPAESLLESHYEEALKGAASTIFWNINSCSLLPSPFLATTAGQRRSEEAEVEDEAEDQQSDLNEPPTLPLATQTSSTEAR